MQNDLVAVLRAANAVARWHVDQRRKGAAAEPYVNHLLEVASLVAHATAGKDVDLVIAALLHDAIEDQEVSGTTISMMFGDDVAFLVDEVTDDRSLDKATRKRHQIERGSSKSPRAQIIKLADKISNLRALTASPPESWPLEQRHEYLTWARKVAATLAGSCPVLEEEFKRVADEADASLAVDHPGS